MTIEPNTQSSMILREYDDQHQHLLSFESKLVVLVRDILHDTAIAVHSISSRLKSRSSLEEKISREGKSYPAFSSITDVIGIRIIVYFAEDVDAVATVIEQEFSVDKRNSVDKRTGHSVDAFGYASLHYVVTLSNPRLGLREYRTFGGMKAEIQIRSVLQHAWAEMEHDLGYKFPSEVPRDARRRFSRLAGLLELADDEFCRLRKDLHNYEQAVSDAVPESLDALEIDDVSLAAFLRTNPIVNRLDQAIAAARGMPVSRAQRKLMLAERAAELRSVGLSTIGDISRALDEHETTIILFAQEWLQTSTSGRPTPRGISLFYLAYVLAASQGSVEYIVKYLEAAGIGKAEQDPQELAGRIMNTYVRAASRAEQA